MSFVFAFMVTQGPGAVVLDGHDIDAERARLLTAEKLAQP
jgi:hypothetical protein